MKIYQTLLYSALVLLSLSSCSKEGDLEPSGADKNYFAADDNATDQESVLRRDFYKKNSSYVLFNDTLRREELGADANGVMQYFIETVDVPYTMNSTPFYAYKYQYMTDISNKRSAVSFVEDDLLPHLSAKLRPFSWLLVNHVTKYGVSDNVYTYNSDPLFVVGNRATAVALETLQGMDDSQKSEFAKTILDGIIANKVVAQTTATLEPFTKYSSSLYGTYTTDYVWTEEENLLAMNKAGFVTAHYYDIYLMYNTYPSKEEDIASFAKLVVEKTQAEVQALYPDNTTILTKYLAMRAIVSNLGYVF